MTEIPEATAAPTKKKSSKLWLVILLVLVALNVVVVMFYKPGKPEIEVASNSLIFDVVDGDIVEKPWFSIPFIGDVYLTNSLVSTILTYIVIIWLAIVVRKQTKDGQLQSHGIVLLLEFVISALCNMGDSAVEPKYRKKIYPYFMGIFFYVLISNLTKLLPIYETIGFAVPVAHEGFLAERWGSNFMAITGTLAGEGQQGYRLISWLRGGPTDLNFTLAVAIMAVVFIQIVGVQARGIGYFNKFINIQALIKKPGMGIIDFIVGILELVAEIAKVASFGFRLFGNMFAGMVLLLFIGFMVPWVASSVMMLYEVFVGILQAFIFGMLTTVFMGMAVSSSE